MTVHYCSRCGAHVCKRWMETDGRERFVCAGCGRVHYENPRILVSCLVESRGAVLMCQRAHEPAKGLWTPPSGYMETGETLEQAAARETCEETGVVLDETRLELHMVSNIPWTSEVYIGFRGQVSDATVHAGPESLAARFFTEQEIPWEQLAFKETAGYLRLFFRERKEGRFGIHLTRIDATGGYRRQYLIDNISDIFQLDPPTSRPAD